MPIARFIRHQASIRGLKSPGTNTDLLTIRKMHSSASFHSAQANPLPTYFSSSQAKPEPKSRTPMAAFGSALLGLLGLNVYKTVDIAKRVEELETDAAEKLAKAATKTHEQKSEATWKILFESGDKAAQEQFLKWMQQTNHNIRVLGRCVDVLLQYRNEQMKMVNAWKEEERVSAELRRKNEGG